MKETPDHENRRRILPQAAFLVRCWREGDAGAWRYSLESVTTRQRRGFSSAEDLLEGLRVRLPNAGEGYTSL